MEVWKDVNGYEGIYQVSNLGNVKRVSGSTGVNKKYADNYILKPLDNGSGYFRVKLSRNNTSKRFMLHRLIAKAFIDNPSNYPVVNHIDHNPKNNKISNLEWCTQSQNVLHAVKFNRWNQENIKGKGYFKSGNKYYARIVYKKHCIYLGSFDNEFEAREIYLFAHKIKVTRKFTKEEVQEIINEYKKRLKNI